LANNIKYLAYLYCALVVDNVIEDYRVLTYLQSKYQNVQFDDLSSLSETNSPLLAKLTLDQYIKGEIIIRVVLNREINVNSWVERDDRNGIIGLI
jgi:hypothetical protein